MAMNDDDDDQDFMTGMKRLLNFSKEKVENILEKIDAEDLIELHDAVITMDKERALQVIKDANIDEDDEREEASVDKETTFQIGDAVKVGDDTGTVEKPHAPHGLIGVKIKGKLRMVHPKNVKLDEAITGMSPMTGLARMRELAGILPTVVPQTVAPPVEVEMYEPEETTVQTPTTAAFQALSDLEAALPNITVADLKSVRAKIYQITSILNESMDIPRRLKK